MAGYAVRLVERQPKERSTWRPPTAGRLALLAGSVAILVGAGAWPQLAPHAEPVERVEVVDVEGGGRLTTTASSMARVRSALASSMPACERLCWKRS